MKEKINTELKIIDRLLRDPDYNASMAKMLEDAYKKSESKDASANCEGEEKVTTRITVKEEKIAINIAGFYALECGLDLLCNQTNESPVASLKKITSNTANTNAVLLLNLFANATWKAGQPFRDLKRITRPVFTVAYFLSQHEVKKDHDQIVTAATKLLSYMQAAAGDSTDMQMQMIRSLMQDKNLALEMAAYMEAAYYTNQQQTPPAFLNPSDDRTTVIKSVHDQKIAMNVAAFYALECGLSYFVAEKKMEPSKMLQAIVNNTMEKEDRMLLLRLANATWKAGQPFLGLDSIEKNNFIPFYFLDEAEVEKDMIKIKAAAKKLLNDLK